MKKYGTAKTPEKNRIFHKWSSQPIECCFESGGKFYNQKFDNFSLKSELEAERVPVKPLKRFLWTHRRQFWQPRGKTFDKSIKKKHKFRLSSKIEDFCQNVSVDTLNAATTNSMDFFSRKSDKSSQDYPTYLTTIRLLKTIAFLKNLLRTNGIRLWQPCLFGQRTGNFLLGARKNFAEVLDRRFNRIWRFFKKTQCSSISFAGSMDYSFNNPGNGFLSKCKKNLPGSEENERTTELQKKLKSPQTILSTYWMLFWEQWRSFINKSSIFFRSSPNLKLKEFQ